MTIAKLERDILIEGVERKISDCEDYLHKYFISFSDKSSIRDLKTYQIEEDFENETIHSVYELSEFVRECQLLLKIVKSKGFDKEIENCLEENKRGLQTILRYLKSKTRLFEILQDYYKAWDGKAKNKYNKRVISAFRFAEKSLPTGIMNKTG